MVSVTCTTLNIRGGRDPLKRYQIFDYLKKTHTSDAYFLQETHTVAADEPAWRIVWRGDCIFSHENTYTAGIAILLTPNSNAEILSTNEVINGRLLHAHVRVNGDPIHFINMYAPNNGNERLQVFLKLKQLLNDLNDDPVILGGDFNCTIEPKIDRTSQQEPDIRTSLSLDKILHTF